MDEPNHAFKHPGIIPEEQILAVSWNIACEPKLYRKLAPNPYAKEALQVISERFPNVRSVDIIRTVILAEPEGIYDRNFRLLGILQQEEELQKQRDIETKIYKRLIEFYEKYTPEFNRFPREFIYSSLSIIAFETADLNTIEEKYSQNQRRDFKLSIVKLIEGDNGSSKARSTDKKTTSRRLTLPIVFFALSLVTFFYFSYEIYAQQFEQSQAQSTNQLLEPGREASEIEMQKENQITPSRLKIPKINVDATIEYMSVTPDGTMDVPSNTIDVGWYKFGPIPGEIGNAVISGHFDGRIDKHGVFNDLNRLKQGDKIYVINKQGKTTTFVVRESRTYNPGYADEVFLPNDNGIHLNLITCDGVWNGTKKSYTKRLVVFADIF